MKSTIRIILASAALTAIAIKAAPAISQVPPADLKVSVVRTADLDLSTNAGQRQLDQRISIAAREVCGGASATDLKGANDIRNCRQDVLAAARAKATAIVAGADNRDILVAAQR